jgi:hypothetical protein
VEVIHSGITRVGRLKVQSVYFVLWNGHWVTEFSVIGWSNSLKWKASREPSPPVCTIYGKNENLLHWITSERVQLNNDPSQYCSLNSGVFSLDCYLERLGHVWFNMWNWMSFLPLWVIVYQEKLLVYGPGLVNFFPWLLKEVKMNFFGRSCLGHMNGSGGWCSLEDGFQISCSFGWWYV